MTLLDLPTTARHDSPAYDPQSDAQLDLLVALTQSPPVTDAGDDTVDEVTPGSSFARCADGNGTLTHLFFSDDEFDIARAKAICGKCGLAERCLRDALARAEAYGVWGGELVIDGEIIKIKRGRGRPPKHPRPPLVVDEVPLPPHLVA